MYFPLSKAHLVIKIRCSWAGSIHNFMGLLAIAFTLFILDIPGSDWDRTRHHLIQVLYTLLTKTPPSLLRNYVIFVLKHQYFTSLSTTKYLIFVRLRGSTDDDHQVCKLYSGYCTLWCNIKCFAKIWNAFETNTLFHFCGRWLVP